MAWAPRDAEEVRCNGGSGDSTTITPDIIKDAETARIEGVDINWTGRDAEDARSPAPDTGR